MDHTMQQVTVQKYMSSKVTCHGDATLLEAGKEGVVLIGLWGPRLSHHWQVLFILHMAARWLTADNVSREVKPLKSTNLAR